MADRSLEKVNAGALSSRNLCKSVPDVWLLPAVFENIQSQFIRKQADVYNIKTPQPIINQPPQNNKQIIKQYCFKPLLISSRTLSALLISASTAGTDSLYWLGTVSQSPEVKI